MTLHGLDCSDFDSPFNVAGTKAAGMSWITNKATEGTSVQHSSYAGRLNAARAAGFTMYGAYHVVRTGNIAGQVAYFLAYLDAQTPWWRTDKRFVLQVDAEVWPYDAVSVSTINAFIVALQVAVPDKVIVTYASTGQYGLTKFGNTPGWNAAYGWKPTGNYADIYATLGGDSSANWHGNFYTFWQYTDQGWVTNDHHGDVSAFRGTVADLEALLGINSPPVVRPSKEVNTMHKDLVEGQFFTVTLPAARLGGTSKVAFSCDLGTAGTPPEVRVMGFKHSTQTWYTVYNPLYVYVNGDPGYMDFDSDVTKLSVGLTRANGAVVGMDVYHAA